MLRTLQLAAILLFLGGAISCVPPPEDNFDGIVVDLNDPVTRRIYKYQNDRNADSLRIYLSAPEPSYRYQAARALASFATVPNQVRTELREMLGDQYELVRVAAAFAFGQTGDADVAPTLVAAFDTSGRMPEFNAAVLAAVGKTGGEELQRFLPRISTYESRDTVLLAGRLRSLFCFARRGITSPEGDSLVVNSFLDANLPPVVRSEAAYFLQRFPVALTEAQSSDMRALFRNESQPDLLMGAARALGRAASPAARVALLRQLRVADDWRVRVEIIRALGDYDYALVNDAVVEQLSDEHPLVRKAAAEFFQAYGVAEDATLYHRLGRDSVATDVRYLLYGAANQHLPLYLTDYRGRINYDLQQAYAASTNVYEQSEIIRSLAAFPWNYRTIHDLYREATSPVVRSAAAEALYTISQREDFAGFFRRSANRVRLDLASFFQEMISSLAVGPAYHAANAITARPDIYRPLYPDRAWLRTALAAFNLPKAIEAYYAVDAARAALAGETLPEPTSPITEVAPIDWELLEEGGHEVQFRTSAGRFTLHLLPDLAPATASNFLRLVDEGYYDGKVFHRVVPNFVAQGGGPLGDGFGAEAYSLRTETPGRRWDRAGLVGLASAGRDTEGVQFFITHRPVPHLDGNYTIFAEVIEGQEAVDRITVGTTIDAVVVR